MLINVSFIHNISTDGMGGGFTNPTGNIDTDPLFVDPDGADDLYGTLDDDLRLGFASPADTSVAYSDPGVLDTPTAQIDWGDGNVTDGIVDPLTGLVTGSLTYAAPGIYTLVLTIEDGDGGMDTLTISVTSVVQFFFPWIAHQ